MRLLFLGDVVGRAGREAVVSHLPELRTRWRLDCVVINGENAAGGFGITEAICAELIAAGADAVTLGNHAWTSARRSSSLRASHVWCGPPISRREHRDAAPP